jgi:ribulose-5-phosphate 4-epimerase/fuculose-1-phosphate aldolase
MNTAQAGSNLDASITGLRVQIAALTRLLHKEGILTYSGHASVRIPGRDAFLIQSINDSRASIEPGGFLVCDFDCNMLEGPAGQRPPLEVFIHSEILRARPDAQAVVHTHSDLAAMFTMLDGIELALMKSHAHRWASGVPTHPDPSHIKTANQGKALAASLGDHHGALMRAGGGKPAGAPGRRGSFRGKCHGPLPGRHDRQNQAADPGRARPSGYFRQQPRTALLQALEPLRRHGPGGWHPASGLERKLVGQRRPQRPTVSRAIVS